ncbi:hypothetical protein R3P38DRAFT_3561155 [Favolaschia claudopus]|uniref:Vacuolar protein sorting-associated protein 13 second N-terminal domain-containing protein n=1 Tax=Favolaschia claudopus TaxID=2862362 RepID=A0AAW0AV07_9AGAR
MGGLYELGEELPPTLASSQVSSTRSELPDHAGSQLKVSITGDNGDDMKALPPSSASLQVNPACSELFDHAREMWQYTENRSLNHSKAKEKALDRIDDAADVIAGVQASSEVAVGAFQNVTANDQVKAIGNALLEGVPAIMKALEVLTEVHPFLKAAYFPFKLIYEQEVKRRDTDKKRNTLFGKIKDFMMILSELKDLCKDDSSRTTPNGESVPSRLEVICNEMVKDIKGCYNVLAAQDKRSLGIKFLKASIWNNELGMYAARFTTRREELSFALSLRSAITDEETKNNTRIMMQLFSTMLTPQERDMGRWIQLNGGENVVMKDDKKCIEMIKYQDSLSPSTVVTVSHNRGGRLGLNTDDEPKKNEKLIADLRQEYREDVKSVIQENLESFSKLFKMGVEDLGKNLGDKIHHEGDRIIKYLQGGPYINKRIKNKIVYRVWKDQGWRGSARTRMLVLSLRDYLVERVEQSKLAQSSTEGEGQRKRSTSRVSTAPSRNEEAHEDDDNDPETDISKPLPDDWMTSYLQVKRLRYLEQNPEALDPDSSGFTTISEVNAFSQARPEGWSFQHWVSYWAIGWQIYATKYCAEIEEILGQMNLLKKQIAIQMPGNTRYVNDYIEGCWQHVTALTSSIERDDGIETCLEGRFTAYIQAQEIMLKDRLDKIQYNIGNLDTVALILHGDRIEGSIFILLAILLRRHVAKMHVALEQDLHRDELWGDMATVTWVSGAAYTRFRELRENFQHQQVPDLKLVFQWLSCGLFKNYYEWDHWTEPKHFMENDMTVWTSDTLRKLDPSELKGILVHAEKLPAKPESQDSAAAEPASPHVSFSTATAAQDTVEDDPSKRTSPAAPVEAPTTDKGVVPGSCPVVVVDSEQVEMPVSILGRWCGYHWTEKQKPFLSMPFVFDFTCQERQTKSETNTLITGSGTAVTGYSFTLKGTLNSPSQTGGIFTLCFERCYIDDGDLVYYNGTFSPDRDIMTGTFRRDIASGGFLFKKVPRSAIMCVRPLVAQLDPKQLWAFAIKAVVDDIKRKRPPLSYLCTRMSKIRQLLRFIYRDNGVRGLLDEPETTEYSQILRTFSFEEMMELFKLSDWYDRAGNLQLCHGDLVRSRIVCLECVRQDRGQLRTIDACSKLECIAAEVPHRTDVNHNPKTHLMVRFRDLLLLKDYFSIKQQAGYSFQYARDAYRNRKSNLSPTVPLPSSPNEPDSEVNIEEPEVATMKVTTNAVAVGESLALPAVGTESHAGHAMPVDFQPSSSAEFVSTEKSPSSLLSTSETDQLLSVAVKPLEKTDNDIKCIVCQEGLVAPCWYCVTCSSHSSIWVCDRCEKDTNELLPWDYIKRYRAEAKAEVSSSYAHTVMHPLVRITGFNSDEDAKYEGGNSNAGAKVQGDLGKVQWGEVEKKIEKLTARFEAVNSNVDKRLDEVETKLEARLANIERLLASLVGRAADSES